MTETTLPPRPGAPVVLCVDDDPNVLNALRRTLSREPFELLTTSAPAQALEWLGERDVRLVIADLRMPGMNGADLLEAVRARSPSTPRMMLTAYPSSARIIRSMREGVGELMAKPWDDSELKRTIRALLQAPPGNAADPEPRVVIPIDCRGVTPDEALLAVDGALRSMDRTRGCDLHLENLPLLQGSASRLLLEIGRLLVDSGVRASVAEPSGLARAFLDAMGGMTAAEGSGPRRP